MDHVIVDVCKHVEQTHEIFVRILLARCSHVDGRACGATKKPITISVTRVPGRMTLHGSIDHGDGVLCKVLPFTGPVPESQISQRAENAAISRGATSLFEFKISKEFRSVQQALQHGIAVA